MRQPITNTQHPQGQKPLLLCFLNAPLTSNPPRRAQVPVRALDLRDAAGGTAKLSKISYTLLLEHIKADTIRPPRFKL
jgi:hypothetical protein